MYSGLSIRSKPSIESNENVDLGYRRVAVEEVAEIVSSLEEASSLRAASLPITFAPSGKMQDSLCSDQGSDIVSSDQQIETSKASQAISDAHLTSLGKKGGLMKSETDTSATLWADAVQPAESLQKPQIQPSQNSSKVNQIKKSGHISESIPPDFKSGDNVRGKAGKQGDAPVRAIVDLQDKDLKYFKYVASEYYYRGDFANAKTRFEFLVRSYPSSHKSKSYFRLRLSLAQITWFNGKYKSAEGMFKDLQCEIEQAADTDTDAKLIGDTGKGIALAQLKQGWTRDARNTIRRYCQRFENAPQPSLLSTWALVLASSGAFRHAWQLSKEAIHLAEGITKHDSGHRENLQKQNTDEVPYEIAKQDICEDVVNTCLYNHARISSEMGKLSDANLANEEVLKDLQHRLGPQHIITLDAASLRAWLLVYDKKPTDAGEEVLSTFRQMRERLDESHPSTLQAMQTLVLMYKSDGRYSDAKETALYLVDRCAKSEDLGDAHPQTLKSRAILAEVLLAIGDWDKAKTIALSIVDQEKTNSYFGVTLATILRTKGEWDPAHEKAIDILLHELNKYGDPTEGEGHLRPPFSRTQSYMRDAEAVSDIDDIHDPLTEFMGVTFKKNELKELLFSSDRLRRGIEQHIEQGFPDPFQGLEPFHVYPSLIRTIHCLALCEQVRDDADLNFVHDMLKRLLVILDKELGQTHRLTVNINYDLAVNYRLQGMLAESLDLIRFVTEERLECLGSDHPDYLVARHQYAVTLFGLRKWEEALDEQEITLRTQEYLLGDGHADTVISRYTLSGIYHSLDRFQEADDLLHKVIDDQKRLYGSASADAKGHPIVLRSRVRHALIHLDMGKYDSAEEEQRMVYHRRREKFSELHSLTRNSKNDLAQILQAAGKLEEAKDLYLGLERDTSSTLKFHPETLSHETAFLFLVQSNLASCLFDLAKSSEDYEEAKKRQEALYSQMKKSPPTYLADERLIAVAFNLALTYRAMDSHLDAYDKLHEAAVTSRGLLGDEHPQTKELIATLTAWWEEGTAFRDQQERNKAHSDSNGRTLAFNPGVLHPTPAVDGNVVAPL